MKPLSVTAEPAAIDTGDHVKHHPSGETWLVAYVTGDRLVACGWPESMVPLSDCLLVKKATPEERTNLLHSMAQSSGSRAAYAQAALAKPTAEPDSLGNVTERCGTEPPVAGTRETER